MLCLIPDETLQYCANETPQTLSITQHFKKLCFMLGNNPKMTKRHLFDNQLHCFTCMFDCVFCVYIAIERNDSSEINALISAMVYITQANKLLRITQFFVAVAKKKHISSSPQQPINKVCGQTKPILWHKFCIQASKISTTKHK